MIPFMLIEVDSTKKMDICKQSKNKALIYYKPC